LAAQQPVEVRDTPVAVSCLAALALALLDNLQPRREHHEIHRSMAEQAKEALQVFPQREILHDRGDPRLGVAVSNHRGQIMAQMELSLAVRTQWWSQFNLPGDNYSPEEITMHVRGRRKSPGKGVGDCRLAAAITPVMTMIAGCSSTSPGCRTSHSECAHPSEQPSPVNVIPLTARNLCMPMSVPSIREIIVRLSVALNTWR
jgi:hypothetical protein